MASTFPKGKSSIPGEMLETVYRSLFKKKKKENGTNKDTYVNPEENNDVNEQKWLPYDPTDYSWGDTNKTVDDLYKDYKSLNEKIEELNKQLKEHKNKRKTIQQENGSDKTIYQYEEGEKTWGKNPYNEETEKMEFNNYENEKSEEAWQHTYDEIDDKINDLIEEKTNFLHHYSNKINESLRSLENDKSGENDAEKTKLINIIKEIYPLPRDSKGGKSRRKKKRTKKSKKSKKSKRKRSRKARK